ncbi:FAD-dependent 5-carboxymethylaminomethyl-2-thiouridine(34) oxidoreductase MnmC [Aquirhabdus sp.]|uniref:FAD-dependent 5-carboxymethylaminomethyl-2-thiouridine(34) oxidoreductase MnmC n=1 Tax=Aquirhabdus sp. TaxID=2824160 RepID=UPI00396C4F39
MTTLDDFLISQHQISEQELGTQFSKLDSHQCLTLGKAPFKSGIVYLKLWKLWQQTRPNNHSRLHIVATAKEPLSQQQIQLLLAEHPEYQNLAHQLLAQYPPAISGIHRLIYPAERLTLDLCFGDTVDDLMIGHPPIINPEPAKSEQPSFAVIGAGIAGLSITDALTRRGYAVTLIEQDEPLAGASGNPRALLLSKLPKLDRVSNNLQTLSALSTARWWNYWAPDVVTHSGALIEANADDLEKIKNYPDDMVQRLQPEDVQTHMKLMTPRTQMFMPRAVVINPKAIRDHVLSSAQVTLLKQHVAELHKSPDNHWLLLDNAGVCIATRTHVIVANAKDSERLCPTLPPLTVIRGQMSWIESNSFPDFALGYGGYAVNDREKLILGSSFIRDDMDLTLRDGEHQSNLELFKHAFPKLAATLPHASSWQGRASLRALPRDSMPIVGEVSQMQGVYALTGLGSKGFSFAPLCAELLAAQILEETPPLPNPLILALSAHRFIKKERIRKPYYTPPQDN